MERRIWSVSVLLKLLGRPEKVPLLSNVHGSEKLISWSTDPCSFTVAVQVQLTLLRLAGQVSVTIILCAVASESLLTSI